jgi:hypothetical protein
LRNTLLVLLLIPAAYSQYPPGQYPPGQYPPGQYPPGRQGPGIPAPRKGKSSTTRTEQTDKSYVIRGVVRSADAKSVEVEAEDERIITFQIVETTKNPDKVVAYDKVEIDATQDDKGLFIASNIKKTGSVAPPPQETAQPGQPGPGQVAQEPVEIEERPTTRMATEVKLDADEGAPPKLKRGIPKQKDPPPPNPEVAANPSEVRTGPAEVRTGPVESAPVATAPAAPTPDPQRGLLDRAREVSQNFLANLPNFVCQQFTTRYVSEGHVNNWHAVDVVSADVIYEDHKERYEHIAIGGKPVKGKAEDSGAWSTGEFGTVLDDLFSPATAADFKYKGNRSILRRPAMLFDYNVIHQHSHWKIQVPGQAIMPAYHGSVWIDKETARVLRIEMQAVKIPEEFPDDTTEMAIDYDFITSLGTEKHLLPVKAEVLSCQRGTNMCQRNTIEFRNYHKFSGESTITFK